MIARGRSHADYSSIPGFPQASLRPRGTLHGLSHACEQCVDDLAATGQLVRIEAEIDPHLEAAEIQRRVYRAGGPAVYFARIKGCRFPMVGNLFGTHRADAIPVPRHAGSVHRLIEMKIDPPGGAAAAIGGARQRCGTARHDAAAARRAWPGAGRDDDASANCRSNAPGPTTAERSSPGRWSTPKTPIGPACRDSNLGVYRVQLSGGQYQPNAEVGLHYQIHRGIGVHHAAAIRRGEPLRVNIFVGGAPAMTVAAVMPLPEGLSGTRALPGRSAGGACR